jgi:hypothetical protein
MGDLEAAHGRPALFRVVRGGVADRRRRPRSSRVRTPAAPKAAAVVAEDLRARRRRLHRARQAAGLAAAVPAVVAVPAAAGPMVGSRSSASPAGTATDHRGHGPARSCKSV